MDKPVTKEAVACRMCEGSGEIELRRDVPGLGGSAGCPLCIENEAKRAERRLKQENTALPTERDAALAAAQAAVTVERAVKDAARMLLDRMPPTLQREQAVDLLREYAKALAARALATPPGEKA